MEEDFKKWLIDHEKRLTRLEAYIKLIAAETTLLLPLVVAVILWFMK
jgi:hypothetical protein